MPEIHLPAPHSGQRIVRAEARRLNWLCSGRRWRKSTTCAAIAVEAAAILHKRVVWGAPVYDQVRVAWDEVHRATVGVASFAQSRMEVTFPRGGTIVFRSLDNPDNVRGHAADLIVIDEAGDVQEAAWREVLRPMLIDSGGQAWIVGTPRGHNWFWQEWLAACDRADSRAWQAPTLGCEITAEGLIRKPHPLENPEIAWSEIEELYRTMPESVFRAEIMAEFIADSGTVFRNVSACISAQAQFLPIKGHTYAFGIDWGRQHDFTVVSVIDCTSRRQVWMDRFSQVDFEFQYNRIKQMADRYKPALCLIETNSIGRPGFEALARRGLRVQGWTASNASKAKLIEDLSLAFDRGRDAIGLLNESVQTAELLAFGAKRLPSGTMTYGAPPGMHDDTVIALALAYQCAMGPHRGRTRQLEFAVVQ